VHILGRYKDLIIRGGENISPAKIEKCLEQIPGLFVSFSTSLHYEYLEAWADILIGTSCRSAR
jgi:acyl-CoA synthetase (AMP-forming)/AMP-acid ligase II